MANGKRFIAYELVKRLKAGHTVVARELENAVTEREKKKGQKHKVFEESFDAKPVHSREFLLQKVNYIHHNPVSKKWSLVSDYVNYEHSSASFYELDLPKLFQPKHYAEVW